MSARRYIDVESGVDIVTGLMGAGKSYWGVREAVRIVTQERRPVVTNLPFKWAVVRRWLRSRGGEELASLLIPFTCDHFDRFLKRAAHMQRQRDSFRQECAKRGVAARESVFRKAYFKEHGPHEVWGADANWVPALAVIIYDEIQHVYPGGTGGRSKHEPEELQAWVTMIRHHRQRLIAMSQSPMQISITLRRVAKTYMEVRRLSEEKLVWGLRWKHLGPIVGKGMQYLRYTPEALEAKSDKDREMYPPMSHEKVFPLMPRNRWYFRLYSSFTHGGSPRQMQKLLVHMRQDIGLTADGKTRQELEQEAEDMRLRPGKGMKRVGGLAVKAAGLGIVVMLAVMYGRMTGTRPVEVVQDATADSEVVEWGEFTGIGTDYIRVAAERIRVGGRVGSTGAVLAAVDRRGRVAVLDYRGSIWMWKHGEQAPTEVGPREAVLEALQAQLARAHAERRAGVDQDGGGEGGGALGAAAGQPVRGAPAAGAGGG